MSRFLNISLCIIMCSSCVKNELKFSLLDNSKIGIDFKNTLTYTEDFNAYLFKSFYNGAGVGLADLTNDGNLDLFLCGNQTDNRLYIGDGDFNFKDVSDHAGIRSSGSWATGVSIVDINGDGWKDIYVCKSGRLEDPNRRNELFINLGLDGNGLPTFVESAKEYGIDDLGFSIHAVFFDYDRDGDLDMYLSNNSHNPSDVIVDSKKGMRNKKDPGGGNKLYKNESGYFVDVTTDAGIYSSAIGYGLGVGVGDVDRDGWPDIYVANDFFEKDYLYINQRDGTFKESIDTLTSEISLGSMGVDISDMDHDGYPEIFVTEMLPDDESRLKTKTVFDNWDKYALKVKNGYHHQFPRNTFQLNNGRSFDSNKVSFSEISRYAGVHASDWSWGVQMVDFDNDGNKEIFITNGIGKDLLDQDYLDYYDNPQKLREILKEKGQVMKELLDNMPSEPISNHLYQQTSYMAYTNVAEVFGLGQASFSSGSAYGDIDNDGDLDLVVNNINSQPFVYENNQLKTENHYVSLLLKNRNGGTAIGAQVSLWSNGKLYFEELYPMKGSMSTVDDRLHIGLGDHKKIDTLKIMWPDGDVLVQKNISADRSWTITQSEDSERKVRINKTPEPNERIEAAKALNLMFVHEENEFIDFDKDNMLFHMRSNEGPKIAVADINGDGLDDCYIGGAKGQNGALFVQEAAVFKKTDQGLMTAYKGAEDQHAVFVDVDNDGDNDLLVASGGYEFSSDAFALSDRLYLNDGTGHFAKSNQVLPTVRPTATSVIISADYDADGDQDLFFGSRFIPGMYGIPASSYLLENDGTGHFTNVTDSKAPTLTDIGMVTDAVWTDVDRDGDSDLIVVGEWMAIKLLINNEGIMEERSSNNGFLGSNGFWNTIEAADLDNDGDQDLIVGNMGENTIFKASEDRPVEMFVNDFDKNGSIEQIITTYTGEKAHPVILKKEITKQLPYLLKKYLKHNAYKEETIADIFTKNELKNSIQYQVYETGTCVFWNDDGNYRKEKMPFRAQLAPTYAIHVSDLDNDGDMDLVMGGNQFKAKPQTGMYAATQGVTLQNNGNGKFTALTPKGGKLEIAGQVRDFNSLSVNGEKYLLVARNNDSIKVIPLR